MDKKHIIDFNDYINSINSIFYISKQVKILAPLNYQFNYLNVKQDSLNIDYSVKLDFEVDHINHLIHVSPAKNSRIGQRYPINVFNMSDNFMFEFKVFR